MGRARKLVLEAPLFIGLCGILILASLLRFAWDIGAQTLLHMLTLGVLLIVIGRDRLSFSWKEDGPLALFAAVVGLSALGNLPKAPVRGEFLLACDAMLFVYLVQYLSVHQKRILFAIPVVISFFFAILLMAGAAMKPEAIACGEILPREITLNANVVGGYLAFGALLSTLLWDRKERTTFIPCVVIFLGVLLTNARAVIAVTTLGLCGAYVLRFGYRKTVVRLLVVLSLAAIIGITILKPRSLDNRVQWWRSAVVMFAANPLNGVGAGNFGNRYLNYRPAKSLNTLYAHDLYLQLLAETGTAGMLAFLLVLYTVVRRNRSHVDENEGERQLRHVLLIAAGAFLLVNVTEYGFSIPGLMLLFWACAGATARKPLLERDKRLLPWWGLAAVFVVGCLWLSKPFAASRQLQRGMYYQSHGDFAAARTSYERSLKKDPLSFETYNRLAGLYCGAFATTKDRTLLDKAVVLQRQAVQLYPFSAEYQAQAGWLYRLAGDTEKANEYFGRAAELDPLNPHYKERP